MLLQSSKTANPLGEIFICACSLPRGGRMGKPLGLTLHPCPGGYLGLTPPCLLVLKIVPSLTELPIFQIALQQKDPAALAQKMGPICNGTHFAGDDRDQKVSSHATHSAAEKPLTGSTATRSNSQSNTNAQPVGAPYRAQSCRGETV
jgi:hypothetical protein